VEFRPPPLLPSGRPSPHSPPGPPTSAEFDAAITARTNTTWFLRLHLTNHIALYKQLKTHGYTISRRFRAEWAYGWITTRSQTTRRRKSHVPESVLNIDTSEQPSREELLLDQMWKLNVRLLADMLDLRVDKIPGDTSTRLKCPCRGRTGYDPVLWRNSRLTDH